MNKVPGYRIWWGLRTWIWPQVTCFPRVYVVFTSVVFLWVNSNWTKRRLEIDCSMTSFFLTTSLTDNHILVPWPKKTRRLHSSRMHTTRSLTLSPSMLCSTGGGGNSWLVPGVCASSGRCLVFWGACLVLGDACLVPGGCLPGAKGGGGIPACTEADPPVNRILDARFWKYYLAPNFVCGR